MFSTFEGQSQMLSLLYFSIEDWWLTTFAYNIISLSINGGHRSSTGSIHVKVYLL